VRALAAAADPAALVSGGAIKFVDCNGPARCRVAGTSTVSYPGDPGHDFATSPTLLTMTAGFAATENGRPFMGCSVTVPATSPAPVRTAQAPAALRACRLALLTHERSRPADLEPRPPDVNAHLE
jgi:hypothetical protein